MVPPRSLSDSRSYEPIIPASSSHVIFLGRGPLLWGNWLVLDFTKRPFDPVEFGRMLALAEQVAGMLP